MRERRFYARGSYRAQGLIALGVGLLLILALPALYERWRVDGRLLNLAGAAIIGIAGGGLLWMAWQYLRPQILVLNERGGKLLHGRRVCREWNWAEVDRIDWIQPASGRFVAPEPYIVLKGYDSEREEGAGYLVALAPFSERAYAAVRERVLTQGW